MIVACDAGFNNKFVELQLTFNSIPARVTLGYDVMQEQGTAGGYPECQSLDYLDYLEHFEDNDYDLDAPMSI